MCSSNPNKLENNLRTIAASQKSLALKSGEEIVWNNKDGTHADSVVMATDRRLL